MPLPAAVLSAAAAAGAASTADLRRALLPRPPPGSALVGASPAGAFARMAAHLAAAEPRLRTRACGDWRLGDLDAAARVLYHARDPALGKLYAARNDRRALHFAELQHKERVWAREADGALAAGSAEWNATRDGKCAEAVMWWAHHLSAPARRRLAADTTFALPLPPAGGVAPPSARGPEYGYQVQCVSCHLEIPCVFYSENNTMECPPDDGKAPPPPAPRNYTACELGLTDGQGCNTCPVDSQTGKPTVWFNRTKRCEWDFDPPCEPCEGIGGRIWGDREEDWVPTACEVVARPEDIPLDNLTTPVWPKHFTQTMVNLDMNTRGLSPCSPKNWHSSDSYAVSQIYYDQIDLGLPPPLDGPQPVSRTSGGLAGVDPKGDAVDQWTLPNGNMYSRVVGSECVCFSDPNRQPRKAGSKDPHPSPDPYPTYKNTLLGPLRYDFPADSMLIARERIFVEYVNRTVVADHWTKGPHHFWFEVSTNLMVRQWAQAIFVQTAWNLTQPDPSVFKVPRGCVQGLLHTNLSCVAPPPAAVADYW